jgi:magnesium-transporting ATPase (P-type)
VGVLLTWACAWTQIFEVPFNSAEKWSGVIVSCRGDDTSQLAFIKGGPEIILARCSTYMCEARVCRVGAYT